MKQLFIYIGLFSLIVVSFYLTDKLVLYVQSKDPIIIALNEKNKKLTIAPVNGVIKNNTIIPGVNGQKININKSFKKMKDFGAFNDNFLVFDKIKPENSLDKNINKIIISGNPNKKNVALIIEEGNDEIKQYFKEQQFEVSLVTTNYNEEVDDYFEIINNEVDETKFSHLEALLKKNNILKNICLVNEINKNICLTKQYYLVKESLTLSYNNIASIISTINNGEIILIKSNVRIADIKVLINQIKFQGLRMVYVSKLINEERE